MAYLGTTPNTGENRKLDDISGSFNGSTTTFDLKVDSSDVYPGTATGLLLSVGGVIQEPETAYSLHSSGKQVTFSTAPATGEDFFGVVLGAAIDINTPVDDSVTTAKIADTAVTTAKIADRAVTQAKLAESSVGGSKVRANVLSSGSIYTANIAGNAYVTRGFAVGYTDGRVPQANLDVKGNAIISSNLVVSSADVTNYIKVGDGTAAQPSIANLGDGNTGIYWPAADEVGITTSGGLQSRFTTVGGNTSIGHSTAPGARLDLGSAENNQFQQKLLITNTGTSRAGFGAISYIFRMFYADDQSIQWGTISRSDAKTFTERMRLDENGNLGIATDMDGHPNVSLELAKSAQAHVRVAGVIGGTDQTTGGTNSYQNTAPQLNFGDAQNWRITLANNVTFGRPWNCNEGQTGSIFVGQDGTGSRTASFSDDWLFPAGTAPTLTTTASANDRIDYIVQKVHHGGQAVGIQAVVTLDLK